MEHSDIIYQEYASDLIKNSLDCISTADENGQLVVYNPAAERTFGFSRQELVEQGYEVMFADRTEFDRVHEIIQRDGQYVGEVLNRRKNGEIFTSFLTANRIFDKSGAARGIMGVSRDITDAKKSQILIEAKNAALRESLTYARRILHATLPSETEIARYFPDHFVCFQPKDFISGDFYLVEKTRSHEGHELYVFVVADCTGHGIPGGILSILCNNLVKQSLTEQSITSPAEALEWMRHQLTRLFDGENNDRINDGMDIGFCVYNTHTRSIEFAGANIGCIIIRDQNIIKIRSDRQHVGRSDAPQAFTNHSVPVQYGDSVYLTTDGIVDQFGGRSNKKFLRKNLHKLLVKHSNLPMKEQGIQVQAAFEKWKGKQSQTDDICLLGIRMTDLHAIL